MDYKWGISGTSVGREKLTLVWTESFITLQIPCLHKKLHYTLVFLKKTKQRSMKLPLIITGRTVWLCPVCWKEPVKFWSSSSSLKALSFLSPKYDAIPMKLIALYCYAMLSQPDSVHVYQYAYLHFYNSLINPDETYTPVSSCFQSSS